MQILCISVPPGDTEYPWSTRVITLGEDGSAFLLDLEQGCCVAALRGCPSPLTHPSVHWSFKTGYITGSFDTGEICSGVHLKHKLTASLPLDSSQTLHTTCITCLDRLLFSSFAIKKNAMPRNWSDFWQYLRASIKGPLRLPIWGLRYSTADISASVLLTPLWVYL